MAQFTFKSGLSRGWTPALVSNRIAMAGWVISLAVFTAVASMSDSMTYVEAVVSSIVVFLGWAIGRELDPDHHWVGAIAMLGTFGAVFMEIPSGWTVGAALLALRVVTGSTGRWIATFDLVFALVIGYGSGADLWSWPIAIVACVAISVFHEFGKQRWLFLGTAVAAFVGGWYLGDLQPIDVSSEQLWIGTGVVVVTAVASAFVSVTSTTDRPTGVIDAKRVRLSRLSSGLFSASAVILGGTSAFWSIAAVPAALVSAAVWNLGRLVTRSPRDPGEAPNPAA